MSYLTKAHISQNASMYDRMAMAAATEGHPSPDEWTGDNARQWASAPGWDAAWESALASHPPENNPHYDPGADEAVITDSMILSQYQAMQSP